MQSSAPASTVTPDSAATHPAMPRDAAPCDGALHDAGYPVSPVLARASVRQFTDEPVTDEQVRALLVAAMAAPSACNQQPWEFFLTRDAATLERLAQATPYSKPTGGAALAIVPCMRTQGLTAAPFVPQDMGACVENILVEAAGMGLGAVWMGIAPVQDRMDEVARIMGVPADDGLESFCIIAVGHPAQPVTPRGPERFDEKRIHWVG